MSNMKFKDMLFSYSIYHILERICGFSDILFPEERPVDDFKLTMAKLPGELMEHARLTLSLGRQSTIAGGRVNASLMQHARLTLSLGRQSTIAGGRVNASLMQHARLTLSLGRQGTIAGGREKASL